MVDKVVRVRLRLVIPERRAHAARRAQTQRRCLGHTAPRGSSRYCAVREGEVEHISGVDLHLYMHNKPRTHMYMYMHMY